MCSGGGWGGVLIKDRKAPPGGSDCSEQCQECRVIHLVKEGGKEHTRQREPTCTKVLWQEGGFLSSGFQIWTSIARDKNRPAVHSLVGHKRAFSGLNSGGSADEC